MPQLILARSICVVNERVFRATSVLLWAACASDLDPRVLARQIRIPPLLVSTTAGHVAISTGTSNVLHSLTVAVDDWCSRRRPQSLKVSTRCIGATTDYSPCSVSSCRLSLPHQIIRFLSRL